MSTHEGAPSAPGHREQKKAHAAPARQIYELIEQMAGAIWRRTDDVNQMIRRMRGLPEPGEDPNLRPKRAGMRDTVRYEPERHGYVVVKRRSRPIAAREAFTRIMPLPLSILVDMFVNQTCECSDAEHREARIVIERRWMAEGKRFDPNGSEGQRRRFFRRLLDIGLYELGVNDRGRQSAARRLRKPAPLARLRERQQLGITLWARQDCIEGAGELQHRDALVRLRAWWVKNRPDVAVPSGRLLSDTLSSIGVASKRGRRDGRICRIFTGIALTPLAP